jgi:predicted nucleotidyltransferase
MTRRRDIAQTVAGRFEELPQVEAVAIAGSEAAGSAGPESDLDLYVYARGEVPLGWRSELARELGDAGPADLDNRFWEPSDEWSERSTGIGIDLMYREPDWIMGELDRVLIRHEASLGYTTCHWHTILVSVPLFDRGGWFAGLREHARRPYPDALRDAIVAKNHAVLREIRSSYRHQVGRGIARRDRVSVLHRTTALLASYFDVVFAVNRVPHPGEKRLVALAQQLCADLPARFPVDVERLVVAVGAPWDEADAVAAVDDLCDGLDALLARAG